MKTYKQPYTMVAGLFIAVAMTACDHTLSIHSEVHPDGALDRTITLYKSDSAKAEHNIFGIGRDSGWNILLEPSGSSAEAGEKSEVNITFKKHFPSVEEANSEMDTAIDTVFRISSAFEKENRWFYTYMTYRDTYRTLNSFNGVQKEDYLTKEDFAFINRLPAEGQPISTADSLYLVKLNEKIFDFYAARTIFEELYTCLSTAMHENDVPLQWQDSLASKKEEIYKKFVNDGELDEGLLKAFRNLGIPVPDAVQAIMARKVKEIDRRAEFISGAYSGKYLHSIRMPWTIVASNADSVVNNQLFWHPPVIKFLLNDYTMIVTARKMNVWAVSVSALVVCAAVALFFVRKK